MKHISFYLLLAVAVSLSVCTMGSSYGQSSAISKKTGGPCEGCEALFEYGNRKLSNVDTLPGFSTNKPQLKVTGRVLKKDGVTPASGVIVYIYHTSRQGLYERKGNETGWARRHGIYRGWIKTGSDGRYTFYTFRPAPYPDHSEPAHIHITVKEPDRNEYYLDEYLFNDDPLLTASERKKLPQRGGSGIVLLQAVKDGLWIAERNLILGLNIPDYE